MVFALFAFVVYYNFLNLGQSWIANGAAQFVRYIVLLHGGVFVLAMGWLLVRHHQWSWRHLLPRASA